MPNQLSSDLPHNIDAEKAVLGAAIISQEAANSVCSELMEDEFYLPKHRVIYHAINNIVNVKHSAISGVTLIDELINMKEDANIGGVEYIKECTDMVVSLESLQFHINAVRNQAVTRKMLLTIRGIDEDYRTNPKENLNDFIMEAETKFRKSIERRKVSDFESLRNITRNNKDRIMNKKATEDANLTGLDTGFEKFNFYTQGFQPETVTVLAARPNIGKTAFALNVAYKAASRTGIPVGIFSAEMPKELILQRFIGLTSMVPINQIKNGHLKPSERAAVGEALDQLSDLDIWIDDTPNIKINDLYAKARKLKTIKPNLGLIIIDYLGLLTIPDTNIRKQDNRQEDIRKLSSQLKEFARELKTPILLLCQLGRSMEKRDNKSPMMSDIRESGAIEADADVVVLMYREDYYANNKSKKQAEKGNEESDDKLKLPPDVSYVDFNVAKNRNGNTGKFALFFHKNICRFDEPDPEWYDAYLLASEKD